jgi:hypothetical protein
MSIIELLQNFSPKNRTKAVNVCWKIILKVLEMSNVVIVHFHICLFQYLYMSNLRDNLYGTSYVMMSIVSDMEKKNVAWLNPFEARNSRNN